MISYTFTCSVCGKLKDIKRKSNRYIWTCKDCAVKKEIDSVMQDEKLIYDAYVDTKECEIKK